MLKTTINSSNFFNETLDSKNVFTLYVIEALFHSLKICFGFVFFYFILLHYML